VDPSREAAWNEPTARFSALLALPEVDLPLDEGAFLIAGHAHPGLNLDEWLVRLDEIAGRHVSHRTAAALSEALFVTDGFSGNIEDYSDPRNSLLDDVIDRRLGIPISLSILMIEVGRRIGLGLHGVGMPGHFLVGVDEEPGVFVDPFHAGRILDVDGCREVFAALQGPDVPFPATYLAPTGPRAILLRVLNNLQRSYLARSSVDAVWAARLRLRFAELPLADRRQTATLLGSLGRFKEAAAGLDALADDLDGANAAKVRAEAQALRAREN
jgi:regulator of sirC expression with transglutaminase-like and TPR domain